MNTLAYLLSAKVRAEILRIFFGLDRNEIHLREIERRSGFAIGTVRQETQKLVEQGLLCKRKDGNRTYFSPNTKNPLYPDIHQLVLKTVALVDVLKQDLLTEKIDFAFIFGSFANGTETSESDIDLFVIGNTGLRNLITVLNRSATKLGREINPITMTRFEFIKKRKNHDHFITQLVNSKKIMIIGDVDDFNGLGT